MKVEMAERRPSETFEARVAKYGLRLDALNAEKLHVTKGSKVRLDARGGGIPPARWLRPSTLAQWKEWIGVPQEVVSRHAHRFAGRRAAKLPPLALVEKLAKESREKHAAEKHGHEKGAPAERPRQGCACADREHRAHGKAIHDIARQYLLGDSRELIRYEELILRNVLLEYPLWLFNTIVVASGAVLEYGQGYNVLVADTLIIEQGGTLRIAGSLKIDCRRIARA